MSIQYFFFPKNLISHRARGRTGAVAYGRCAVGDAIESHGGWLAFVYFGCRGVGCHGHEMFGVTIVVCLKVFDHLREEHVQH